MNYDYFARNHVYYVSATTGSDTVDYFDAQLTTPWRTITRAINDSSPWYGDTIRVANGLYNKELGEVFPLNMKDGISLIGASRDSTIIDATGSNKRVINMML